MSNALLALHPEPAMPSPLAFLSFRAQRACAAVGWLPGRTVASGLGLLLAAGAGLAAAPAQAIVLPSATKIFFDNFNGNSPGFNVTPKGWSVSDGTVEVVGRGYFELYPSEVHGFYVDLDGSTNDAGVLRRDVDLLAGSIYTLRFDLAGSARGSDESVSARLGGTAATYGVPSGQAYTRYSLAFTPLTSGSYPIEFANDSTDSVGAILDNVALYEGANVIENYNEDARPVPAPLPLFGAVAGLGFMGRIRRRRRAWGQTCQRATTTP